MIITAQDLITGNVETLADINDMLRVDANALVTYGGGAVPNWKNATVTIQTSMASATVDNLLIASASTVGLADDGLARTWTLKNARTAASNAAVATLAATPKKTIVTSN